MVNPSETPDELHGNSTSSEDERDYPERELQHFLARHPDRLGIPDAIVLASEYQTDVGRIDLLVSSGPRTLWVVELKASVAGRDAIGQIVSYIAAVRDRHPDKAVVGLLVAPDFDSSCLAAHRAIGDVELKTFRTQYVLEQAVPMTPHKAHLPIANENLPGKPLVFANRSGGRTVCCWKCGKERQVSTGAQAFTCTSCEAFNTF